MDQPTKSFNTRGGKNRLRFASAKFRSKRASADVYRRSDNRHSASSTSVREKRVHDTSFRSDGGSKRRKITKRKHEDNEELVNVRYFGRDTDIEGLGIGRTAVIVSTKSNNAQASPPATIENSAITEDQFNDETIDEKDDDDEQTKAIVTGGTIFFTELEVSAQRNGSQLYQKLYRGLRPLCKSLAELLHHRERIIDMLCVYLLSPRGDGNDEHSTDGYVVNTATNDVLHLLGVLARELRQEIYPYLTTRIMPRIIDDMLNPPVTKVALATNSGDSHHQSNNISMDVSHVESAFRTLSYLFKYNSNKLIHNHSPLLSGEELSDNQQAGDADILRQFYGKTICNKREIVRRLACEAYAPLLRKCTEKGLKKHLCRTLKALAGSLANVHDTDEESNMTHSSKRARDDAIDGVSSLFFEVSRGAPGRVHSKIGRIVVKTLMDCLIGFGAFNANAGSSGTSDHRLFSMQKNKARDVYAVASQFLFKLRGHIARRVHEGGDDTAGVAFSDVLDEMHRAVAMATSMLTNDATPPSAESQIIINYVTGHVIDLMTETINFQDGRLIGNGPDRCSEVDRIIDSLQKLISRNVNANSEHKLHDHILQYLCSAWKTNPSHPSFALRLGKYFPSIVGSADSNEISPVTGLDSALFLARNLLPYLPKKTASKYLIPALLGAASSFSRIEKCNIASLELVHAISTTIWPKDDLEHGGEIDMDDHMVDALFTSTAAEHCPGIPQKVRSFLFDLCLKTTELESESDKNIGHQTNLTEPIARVGYVSRCIPFLVGIECASCINENNEDDDVRGDNLHQDKVLDRVFQWYSLVLKILDAKLTAENAMDSKDTFITQSMVLESFSKSITLCHECVSSQRIMSMMTRVSAMVRTYASSLLLQYPHAIWSTRGVAAFTKALSSIDSASHLNDQPNEVFELLVPNLAGSNHFLRLYTLQILDSYPVRPFVADHADLDLTDDLEEEPTYRPQALNEGSEGNYSGPPATLLSGPCDVISLLRLLELIPVALPNERRLTSQLTRIEVYARTGKLPIVYAEAVTCHMLGLLHVKFAPIWPHAINVIVSLSLAQEGPSWPFIEKALKQSIMQPDVEIVCDRTTSEVGINSITHHHSLCVAWETSKGKQIDIFGPRNQLNNTQVSRHVVSDELTLFENIWTVLENGPHLTSTKSKTVVPIFFEFLVSQYYVFHQDEPDSREIDLTDYAQWWPKEELTRKSMQSKLGSFLKVFAAVKGPQQLFKHQVLLQLFVALLANPDGKLSNLAFLCVSRFKLPYLSPYIEYVQPMLKKEGLREALTKFDLSAGGEIVDAEHRLLLLPIVIRILFGRFASRGSGAKKSSKDTPVARRAAILSFFAGIGNDDGELNYFIYLMVRNFIPNCVDMKSGGLHRSKETLQSLIAESNKITSTELVNIPLKRQEGFLNLLSDVITQIGFGVKFFVDTFMNLLIAISEQTEHALVASIEHQAAKRGNSEHGCTSDDVDGKSGLGRIRSLTFLRLADIMGKFASSIDFSRHGERLWKSMSASVMALPNTVINAENPPSLLRLIETLSSHPRLITLLHQSDSAVTAIFKCVAGTTRMKVMHCVLRIIGGLLTDGETLEGAKISSNSDFVGHSLILDNIHLLLAQFTERMGSGCVRTDCDEDYGASQGARNKSRMQQNPTDGLQLNILCRVSELLVTVEDADTDNIATMETLCNLLVPLLKFDSHPNQLYVMRTVNSLIPKLSSIEALMPLYHTISKLLGPRKNSPGIRSNEHRGALVIGISAICNQATGCPNWKIVAQALASLNAASTSYVDEHDYESMLPILNGLGSSSQGGVSWRALTMVDAGELSQISNPKSLDDTRVLQPLIYTCFHMLYDSDGVVSRASNNALKCLLATSSEIVSKTECDIDMNQNPWVKLVETVVVPCLKIGITTKDVATRRIFVLLLSHLARHFLCCNSVHLYGDLRCLIRDDDQDLDYFLNVTHVQVHRRARAFNRLRRMLSAHEDPAGQPLHFSEQSLGNVLLPLAMHPVYECSSKDDEAYTLEAIATVGEICAHLPWSKYNSTLQSVLNNLPRYPDQERFLIAMLCAIIDAFHFSVETGSEERDVSNVVQHSTGNAVWRTLRNRIIPKVESFMVKEKVDKHGSKSKSIRPSVVLALMKLLQKLPVHIFESDLPKLITVVCNALKNKESNERDAARETLSKMAVGLDMKYLPLILSELSVSLSEGYKLHVRSATLHTLLVAVSKVNQPTELTDDNSTLSFFDRCVPAMLDLIHQDIFGKASEIKELEHVGRRLIKEAMGSKSQDSLEIISKCIVFKPSQEVPGFTHASVVHALVTPFLDRLRDPDVSSSTMRKVKECLNRVAMGLSSNPTTKYDEVLPFVYATVAPFVHGRVITSNVDADLDISDDDVDAPIKVSKTKEAIRIDRDSSVKESSNVVPVATWTPSTLRSAASQKSAYNMKRNEKNALHKVSDGAAAPKLTGSSRHAPLEMAKIKTLNQPANACAVSFGLTLLNSTLKKSKIDVSDENLCAMTNPYLRLLTHCVSFSSDIQAVVLSLRCLEVFLRMDLPSVSKAASDLGTSLLNHLTTSSAASNTQSDIVQCCFKTLTLLISHRKFATHANDPVAVPLTSEQMDALLSLLHSAVRENDHHNATFGLVKAIASKRYVSSEFYDLMDIILKLSVQSQKSAIRLLSSQIFVQYLLEYPMGNQRMDNHIHQIVLNIKYEFEEGRLAAIELLSSVIQKFPLAVLDERCQFFFLPLVLQLVNDDSKKCKEAISGCLSFLLQRLSTESVQTLFGYAKRWSQSSGASSSQMQIASAQLFGIFVDSRPDYVKRGRNGSDIMSVIQEVVAKQNHDEENVWELLYHILLCTEKLNKHLPSQILTNYEVWGSMVNLMVYPHPWVMLVASRIISSHLGSIDPNKLLLDGEQSFIVKIPGCLYKIASNSCRQLDVEDEHFVEATSTLAIKDISWAFRAMRQHPSICYDEIVSHDTGDERSKDPCLWVVTRLSNIAKPKGIHRRSSVFKCFAALCKACNPAHLSPYLELMIEPIDRAIREATNKLGPEDQPENDPQLALPKDVLDMLEDTCGTEAYVKALAEVNRKAREKRDKRKQDIASEAVHDPTAAAQRKIKKQLREKDRRKRKVDDNRSKRGASKKRLVM